MSDMSEIRAGQQQSHKHTASTCSPPSTSVQDVDSGDVVVAHLLPCAELNVGVGNGLHGGQAVPREGVPAGPQRAWSTTADLIACL